MPALLYAIKNQLKAPKAPYQGHFLHFGGSLWHKEKKDSLFPDAINEVASLETSLPLKLPATWQERVSWLPSVTDWAGCLRRTRGGQERSDTAVMGKISHKLRCYTLYLVSNIAPHLPQNCVLLWSFYVYVRCL